MTAEASVIVEERTDVLVVPNQYIRLDRRRGTAFVNIVTAEGGLQEVEVSLGLQGRDTSEVVSGLSAGDVLAVDLGGDRLSFIGG
jgi:HlyD family secretion protein